MAEIAPAKQGVKWDTSFMWYRSGSQRDAVIPVRGSGTSLDFNAARIAALAWRPAVSVIDGIASLGITIPTFWFAMILIYFFGYRLNWFSISVMHTV